MRLTIAATNEPPAKESVPWTLKDRRLVTVHTPAQQLPTWTSPTKKMKNVPERPASPTQTTVIAASKKLCAAQ
jgi:hypothetical protein